jgi:hypothetical protein
MFEHSASRFRSVRRMAGIAVLGALAVALLGFVVMGLWNGLLPPLFGFRSIHFWQALGLLLLSRILFGGFHHRHGPSLHRRRRMLQRWEGMTPEEREKFRQGFRRIHRREAC